MEVLVGIDAGTSVLKAAAFDRDSGRLLARASQRLAIETGPGGKFETPVRAVDEGFCTVLARVVEELGGESKRIAGIGLAAQGGSTIIVNRRTAKALTPMFLWNDGRAIAHFHRLIKAHDSAYWRGFSLRDDPGMGLARMHWLKERNPSLFEEGNLYAGAGDYLYHKLTAMWRQDACNAMQTGCYDARNNQLTPMPLGGIGVGLSFFSPIREGHETHPVTAAAASEYQIPEGTPVAGPYSDHEAGYLSAAGLSDSPLQCSLGTAWVGNFLLAADRRGSSPFQFALPSPLGAERLIIQPLLTGNVTWDWALRCWLDSSPEKAIEAQQRLFTDSLLPPFGLTAIPWLNRPHPFRPDCIGGASLIGIGPSTTPADFLRAIASAMVFELDRVFEDVVGQGAVDSVVLCGGGSRGDHFVQLITSLFHPLPVLRIEDEEWMGTRGSVYAFSSDVARASAVPIELPKGIDRGAIAAARALYRDVFQALGSNVPAAERYRVE